MICPNCKQNKLELDGTNIDYDYRVDIYHVCTDCGYRYKTICSYNPIKKEMEYTDQYLDNKYTNKKLSIF